MSNWVQKDAAELLPISPRVMNYKIKTLGIEFPRRPAAGGSAELSGARAATTRGAFGSDVSVGLARVRIAISPGLAASPAGGPSDTPRSAAPRSRGCSAGGAEPRVAEQFLDRAQVGAALEQVRGKRVPQRVRADAEARAAQRDVAAHQPMHAARRSAASPR